MVTLFMGPSARDFFGRRHNQILCHFGDFVDVDEYVINVEFVSEHGRLTRQIHFLHLYIRDLNGFDTDTYVMLCQENLNQLFQYPLRPGVQHNPLVPMLAWNSDVWSFTLYVSGHPLELAFYPLYTDNNPPATCRRHLRMGQAEE